MASTTDSGPQPSATSNDGTGSAQGSQNISLVAFLTALATSLVVFAIQMIAFLLLRNKLARILYVVAPISMDPVAVTDTCKRL
jgi:hypothetical protein